MEYITLLGIVITEKKTFFKYSLILLVWMDGWMDDLRLYVLFNNISVMSGRCLGDNEMLCAREVRLRLRRFHIG